MPVELGALLADSPRLVYAVDAGRAVVYANAAVAEWLGLAEGEVVGRHVEYHSAAAGAGGSLLTGMCPSPDALAGREAVGVVSCAARGGGLRRRRARYLPMGGGVLVIGEDRDLTPQEMAELVSGPATDALHQAIQRFLTERPAAAPVTLLLGRAEATRRLREQFDAAAVSGCNALMTGGSSAERRDLAEAIHRSTAELGTQRNEARHATLLPVDLAIAGVEEVADALAGGAGHGRGPTVLLLDVNRATGEQQALLAKTLREQAPPRVLATAEPGPELRPELESLVATLTLHLPPLADRGHDLPLLFQWFIEQQNALGGKQRSGLSEQAMELLAAYPFRDLGQVEQMIAAAHQSARGPRIERSDLPRLAEQAALAAGLAPAIESVDLDQLLADVEREVVARALAAASGNKAEAARLLGVTRPRFYRTLERLGLAGASTKGEG